MKARDFDTVMSVAGAAVAIALVILKGRGVLNIETNDCILCGALVSTCTKFIALARVMEVLRGAPPPPPKEEEK